MNKSSQINTWKWFGFHTSCNFHIAYAVVKLFLTSDSEAHLNKPKLLLHEDFSHILLWICTPRTKKCSKLRTINNSGAQRDQTLRCFSWERQPMFDHLLDKRTDFYYYAKRNSKSTSPYKCAMWKYIHSFSHLILQICSLHWSVPSSRIAAGYYYLGEK